MCGRFTLHQNAISIAKRFGVAPPEDIQPRFNIAPTQPVAVVTMRDKPVFDQYRWGLVPFWASDPAIGNRMINARAESIAEKPAYKEAIARRRCLVPADGFYEWKREGKRKTPMYVQRKDRELFAFAGIWELWRSGDDELLRTCAIITVEPNALMAPIHDRMPAILARDNEAAWIDRHTDLGEALAMLEPYPEGELDAIAVSSLVNSPANDEPACIEPVEALA